MSNFGVEKNKGESTVSLGSLGNGEVTHELDCGICSQSKISDNHLPFPQFSHEVNIFWNTEHEVTTGGLLFHL